MGSLHSIGKYRFTIFIIYLYSWLYYVLNVSKPDATSTTKPDLGKISQWRGHSVSVCWISSVDYPFSNKGVPLITDFKSSLAFSHMEAHVNGPTYGTCTLLWSNTTVNHKQIFSLQPAGCRKKIYNSPTSALRDGEHFPLCNTVGTALPGPETATDQPKHLIGYPGCPKGTFLPFFRRHRHWQLEYQRHSQYSNYLWPP